MEVSGQLLDTATLVPGQTAHASPRSYAGLEVQLHIFFISALNGSEWTTARRRRMMCALGHRKKCLDRTEIRKNDSSIVRNIAYSLLDL
jgi:hypothetical protein